MIVRQPIEPSAERTASLCSAFEYIGGDFCLYPGSWAERAVKNILMPRQSHPARRYEPGDS